MRPGTTLAALLGAVGAAEALHKFDSRSRSRSVIEETGPGDTAPKRFIVEYKSRVHVARVAARIAARSADDSDGLLGFRVVKEFDSDIFPGVAVECERGTAAESECSPASVQRALNAHGDGDGEAVVASVYNAQILRILPTVEEGESFSDDAAALNYSVHGLTGVEKLHEDGILGEGATVAIVDSGVQYTHPALGGGLGPEFTVAGGYDLVGDDWPNEPARPDSDPMDQFGHGTHVAGIVAGKSDKFVGVAPKAKLLSFKVFGSTGYSNEETVIEGFLKAFDSGADIISASVGEGSGFTKNALAVVASRIVDKGVVVVFAAGNAGEDGPFQMSSGASGESVLTVAASDPGVFPAQAFTADFNRNGTSNKTRVAYVPGSGFFPDTVVDWPVTPVSLNVSVEDDACRPLPQDTPRLNETIVLIRLGGCTITDKHNNAAAFGAQLVLFYSDDDIYTSPVSAGRVGLVGLVEAAAGEAMVKTIRAGGTVKASFDVDTQNYVGIRNAGGGRPAGYTSWGGTFDLALKPDVAAPGTRILSTYPTDGYRVLSGTSMATPYISGIAALWVGRFGGRAAHKDDPEWARRLIARITTTARAVPWADWSTSPVNYGFWAPTTQVGAGFVDARRVLGYTTQLGFDGRKFELNDTAHFTGTHAVDLTNRADEPVTYTFSLQDAGGYDSYEPSTPGENRPLVPGMVMYANLAPIKLAPQVSLPKEITVAPGETTSVEFSFSVPEVANEKTLPVYSGKVLISGSNGEELGIPYFGVACDLKETIESIWATRWEYPFIFSGVPAVRIEYKSSFAFNLTRAALDYPTLNVMLEWGTAELRWDIFSANYTESQWSYPPVPGQKGFIASATSWNGTLSYNTFDPTKDNEDDVFSFPLYSQPRGVLKFYNWLGRLSDGSHIQPGSYKFRIAALRPFGFPEVSGDWNIWETPTITILPSKK